MKRRLIVKISPQLLKEKLFLPGMIVQVQEVPRYRERASNEEPEYIAFKLTGDDLPEVPEGKPIPEIRFDYS